LLTSDFGHISDLSGQQWRTKVANRESDVRSRKPSNRRDCADGRILRPKLDPLSRSRSGTHVTLVPSPQSHAPGLVKVLELSVPSHYLSSGGGAFFTGLLARFSRIE